MKKTKGNLLDDKKTPADDYHNGNHEPVEDGYQHNWQSEAPDRKEARCVDRVGWRQHRSHNPLARTNMIDHFLDQRLNMRPFTLQLMPEAIAKRSNITFSTANCSSYYHNRKTVPGLNLLMYATTILGY
jgi:hypothetical protein